MTSRRIRSLAVTAPGRAAVIDLEEPEPEPGRAWVRTLWSGVSAGTEVALLRGNDPHHRVGWDRRLRTFGTGPRAGYPIEALGYMEVARVEESDTGSLPVGVLVAMAYGHRTGHCVDPTREVVVPIPGDLDEVLGVYLAQMGPIAANGILHAAQELAGAGADADPRTALRGRRLAVTGAGVVGLLTALLGRHLGADVVVVEPSEERRRVASALGLDTLADDGTAAVLLKERWGEDGPGTDRGAEVALQCRGHSGSLATALRCLRPGATVVDLAFYQGGAPDVVLGEEFHHNWLTIRCAQIGRVPRGLEDRWDRRALADLILDLLRAEGTAVRTHLVTDVVDLDEAPALLHDLAARRRSGLTAVLRMS